LLQACEVICIAGIIQILLKKTDPIMETASKHHDAVFEASPRVWMAKIITEDTEGNHLARNRRVMEMLNGHTLEGWLEGYLLPGRHGLFASYEAFAHVIHRHGGPAAGPGLLR
jgi:phosphoketolase